MASRSMSVKQSIDSINSKLSASNSMQATANRHLAAQTALNQSAEPVIDTVCD